MRLWSCAGASGSARSPSEIASTDTSSPVEELLDHAPGRSPNRRSSSIASSARARLGLVRGDHHPLARGQAVGLDAPPGSRATAAEPVVDVVERRGARPVGTPAAAITSFANALLPSSRAAPRRGPKRASPRPRARRTSPATSGASGPTTTRSTPSRPRATMPAMSPFGVERPRRRRGCPRCPARTGSGRWGDRASALTRACSRAPRRATTRTFMWGSVSEGGDAGGRGADRRPTGSSRTVDEGMAAIASYPAVIKADGLAAGKGVVIAAREAEAAAALELLEDRASAPPGASSRSSSPATSCRCSRCATASGRCRWPRRGTTSASATATRAPTPAAWALLAGPGVGPALLAGDRRDRPPAGASTSSRAGARRSTACSTPG